MDSYKFTFPWNQLYNATVLLIKDWNLKLFLLIDLIKSLIAYNSPGSHTLASRSPLGIIYPGESCDQIFHKISLEQGNIPMEYHTALCQSPRGYATLWRHQPFLKTFAQAFKPKIWITQRNLDQIANILTNSLVTQAGLNEEKNWR